MSDPLKNVEWAYGGRVDGFRATSVPGVLVSLEAWPAGSDLPEQLLDYGRQIHEDILEEMDSENETPQMEALMFSGRVQYFGGESWWEFSTLSSYSVTLFVGKRDGYVTTTEEL